jgi:hypothetical protein
VDGAAFRLRESPFREHSPEMSGKKHSPERRAKMRQEGRRLGRPPFKEKLTPKTVAALLAPGQEGQRLCDGAGLYVRRIGAGPAYWVFRFYDRFRGHAEREISLGPETALSLDKARAIADGLRAQIASGYLPNCRVAGAMRRRSIEAGSKDKTNVEGLKVRGFLK